MLGSIFFFYCLVFHEYDPLCIRDVIQIRDENYLETMKYEDLYTEVTNLDGWLIQLDSALKSS